MNAKMSWEGILGLHGRRNTRRRKGWNRPSEPDENRALASYMRDVGATPLLDRDGEEKHAETLERSREALAALVLELPPEQRRHVLNGDPDGPERGARWRLRELDACFRRLSKLLEDSDDPQAARTLQQARRHKRRIEESRDALVLANLRFVAHLAKQMAHNSASFLELIQEGNLGLLEAVERFEAKRGHRFSTYAFWWIRKAQHLALAGNRRMIYVPAHVWSRARELGRITEELRSKLGRQPTAEELAGPLGISPEKVRELQTLVGEPAPLEECDDDGNPWGPVSRVADPNGADPLKTTLDRELRSKIRDSLRTLNPQESLVIRLRFGINRKKRMTLKQIGRILNLSRERVRQIEIAALRKLQRSPVAQSFVLEN